MAIEDLNSAITPPSKKKKQRLNPGFSVTPGMEVPVPIKLDKWHTINTPPSRKKPRNSANTTHVAFVDFSVPTLPPVNIDQWLSQFSRPNRSKIISRSTEYATSYIASINPINGNYFDSGVINLTITVTNIESATYADTGEISFTIQATHAEDFQLEDTEEISFTIKYPDVGVEVFNSGVPGFISATVIINGLNESDFIQGLISVTREDNTAARFEFSLEEDPDAALPRKPVEFINKIVSIAFSAADMEGVVTDYIPIFTGIIKRVVFNSDTRAFNISGYDYSGIHQTKGEYISENITTVVAGSIGVSGAGTINTGHNPIWGVIFNGNEVVTEGVDYFIDTKNGRMIIPISSRILQFPGSFTYSYAIHFNNIKEIIQNIVSKKNWIIQEDGVTIADYTDQKHHPVVSLSNESVIDASRKFLELSGAKIEGNLFPNLRVYSEVENWINSNNIFVIDENVIFENTLVFDIDFDDLLNEQTVRSVQKVHADIVIDDSEVLAEFSDSQGIVNPLAVQGVSLSNLDYQTPTVLAEHRINKRNINSISLSSSGAFSVQFYGNSFNESITGASWNYFIDDDDFVIQLKHRIVTVTIGAGTATAITIITYPAIDYQLTVSGTKINYGGGTPEDVRVVTAQRPISGITDTLKGDVYENPYIETDTHCVNICNAVLLERGNPYTANFEIPIFVGKNADTGDRIDIKSNGNIIFSGIIKKLNYNINLEQGQNSIIISARGVGRGI